MTIEIALLISVASLAFALWQGINNAKRNEKKDTQSDASQLTTVIVKLENIGNGVNEIKGEVGSMKNDLRETRERIIKCEESTKQAHKRLDERER